jgi:hypothetical protein
MIDGECPQQAQLHPHQAPAAQLGEKRELRRLGNAQKIGGSCCTVLYCTRNELP